MSDRDALRTALEAQRLDYLDKHAQSERDAAEFGPRASANGRWKARAEGIEAALFILTTTPQADDPSGPGVDAAWEAFGRALDEMRGFDGTVDWAGFGSALMVHRPLIEAAIRAKKP